MQAPTLIAVLRGPEYVVELANPPVCEVWGRTEAELLNQPLLNVMPELREQVFPALLNRVFQTGTPYVGSETPARLARKEGPPETVYFNFVYSPFRNMEGDIEGVFVIASDVTEQVLARNQLNDLREAAESANRAKDEFLAMLGHELRNPLSPILTALQLMKLRGSDASERERTVIERQVNHLTRLVDDLLDVSRIARGQVELKEEDRRDCRDRRQGHRDCQSAPRAANAYVERAGGAEGTHGEGRSDPSESNRLQPADECSKVHSSRRSHHDPNRAARQPRHHSRPGYRHGHCAGSAAARI